MLIEIPHLDLG